VEKYCGDVVLVDDDDHFRGFLIDVLERAGYSARGIGSAERALAAVDQRKPDIVLADVQLPAMSGYELCRQLKEKHESSLPVIIISGERTEPYDRTAGIRLGADDYMVKPIDPGELLARVWRLVSRSKGHDRAPKNDAHALGKLGVLSKRERQVLDLLAGGSEQNEIAQTLFISPKTVATHIQRILTKLGVRSRTQAVALALRRESA